MADDLQRFLWDRSISTTHFIVDFQPFLFLMKFLLWMIHWKTLHNLWKLTENSSFSKKILSFIQIVQSLETFFRKFVITIFLLFKLILCNEIIYSSVKSSPLKGEDVQIVPVNFLNF